ncbi:acetolactate synthase catalytic subunit [Pusillimonas sp. T7-7]|uniref:acetolactate synthase catalytic subunit n=1 Tax=Pusillimonas sp. (strain T7-7) TaxID=1007105 RepID=UPI0002085088|nr:acetolactate synthase catalytic subunit [Pusillimonas sp. T7-7]AEC21241.1 acetolactate synthase catalytic subunit [Pusillimonas sp. T7-7]
MQTTLTPLTANGLVQSNTVAHAIVRALKRHGITTTFGQSLPSMLHLAAEQGGLKQVAYRTENAGGYMADAYARMTNTPAIVTAQNGPAATLLVAPLAEALKVSIPVIALVQDVARNQTDKNAFQDLDHIGLFQPVTKWVRRITDASRVDDYIDQAFAVACSGRPGPVALMLPADLLLEPAADSSRQHSLGRFPLDRTVASPESVARAAVLLAKARKPLVIAGGGAHISGAYQALTALQEDAHLPIATTVMGKGAVNEQHPLSVGVVGYFMGPNSTTRYQRPLVANADVILLVGTRTNQNATDSWQLYPKNAIYIHLDVDGHEAGRNYESERLVGDASLTLDALLLALKEQDLSLRASQRAQTEAVIAAGKEKGLSESLAVRTSNAQPIRPERIMHELQNILTEDSVVVADASYSSIWIANGLTALRAGQRFITPRGLAGLGWGFPMAMGAKEARPDAEVYCLVGDGGFGHVWAELETAARMNIKVTLILINNGILGYQKHAENVKFGAHTSAVHFASVDHAAIAHSCGCNGVRVTNPADLAGALEQARQGDKTTLIEVICDENAFPPITFYTPDAKVPT